MHGNWDYEQEGYAFPEEKLKRFDLKDIDLNEAIVIDFADVADSGECYFSKPIGAIIGNKVYIIDWIYTNKPIEYWMPIDISNIKKYNPLVCYYESNNQGLMATKFLKDKIGKPYSEIIKAIRETTNKQGRIKVSSELDILPNFYFLRNPSGMYADALEHLIQYKFDMSFKIVDAADSLAGLSKMSKQYRKEIIDS